MKTITLSFYSKRSSGPSGEDLLTNTFSYVQIVIVNFRARICIHIPPGDLLVPPHRSNISDILRGAFDGRDRESLCAWWIHLGHQRKRTQRSALEFDALVTQKQGTRHGQPGCNVILAFPDDGSYVSSGQHCNRILVYDLQGLLWFIWGRNQDHILPDLPGSRGILHGTQRVLVSS